MASLLDNMLKPATPIQAQAPQSPQAPAPNHIQEEPSVASKVVGAVGQAAGIAAMFL